MGVQTEYVTSFTRRRQRREELLARVAAHVRRIVEEAGPGGVYVSRLLDQAEREIGVSRTDASMALAQLVDRNELDYSLEAQVTVAANTRSIRA